MLVFLCFVGFFGQGLSQVQSPGSCPQPKSIANFNATKLTENRWFEWARTDDTYQTDQACGTITYYMGDDGVLIEHYDAIVRSSGILVIWEGKLIPRAEEPTALYDTQFPKYARAKDFKKTFVAANLDHWMILHSCQERGNEALQYVWVWVKNYNLEQQYQDEIRSALKNNNLPTENFSMVDQTNCPNHD